MLFFFCIQLLLNLTLVYWRIELRDPEYAVKLADLRARLAEHPGSPLLLMLGLRTWIPVAWRSIAQAVVMFIAIAVNVTIYTAYVVPYWYFR